MSKLEKGKKKLSIKERQARKKEKIKHKQMDEMRDVMKDVE